MFERFFERIPWSEMFRFGVMGLTSTGIYLLLFVPVRWLIPEPLWLIGAIAYLLSMFANYVLQRNVTFRSQRRHQEAVSRYVVVQLIGLALNAGLLELIVTRLKHPLWFGQSVSVVLVALWSYGAQKFWVFMRWGSTAHRSS
ncbi:MAG: GtrA family protein [Polyangiaceae bacterium]